MTQADRVHSTPPTNTSANNPPVSTPHPDAELIALVEQYIVAEQGYCDLNAEVDDMEGEMHKQGATRRPIPCADIEQQSARRS